MEWRTTKRQRLVDKVYRRGWRFRPTVQTMTTGNSSCWRRLWYFQVVSGRRRYVPRTRSPAVAAARRKSTVSRSWQWSLDVDAAECTTSVRKLPIFHDHGTFLPFPPMAILHRSGRSSPIPQHQISFHSLRVYWCSLIVNRQRTWHRALAASRRCQPSLPQLSRYGLADRVRSLRYRANATVVLVHSGDRPWERSKGDQ